MALASKVTSNQWQGYRKATASAAVPRLVGLSLQKETGSGTSHFWLTAPGPIVVFSLTPGDLEGVVEQFAEKKPIYLKEYEWAPADDGSFEQSDAVALRDEFTTDFIQACGLARTVVMDKESHIWELFRYADFGAPNPAVPRDFDKLNQRYRKLITRPKSLTINFGMIQLMKDEWGSATKKTGGLRPWGFGEVPRIVHVCLEHECGENGDIIINVGKVRGEGRKDALSGNPFTNLDFPTLGEILFPDTEKTDWL